MKIGDTFPYTFESGEQITYKVCTAEHLAAWLERAKSRGDDVRHFDDPFRRVVGWCVGDEGRALTIMEMREKRTAGVLDDWWWEQLRTPAGREKIASRYSPRSS